MDTGFLLTHLYTLLFFCSFFCGHCYVFAHSFVDTVIFLFQATYWLPCSHPEPLWRWASSKKKYQRKLRYRQTGQITPKHEYIMYWITLECKVVIHNRIASKRWRQNANPVHTAPVRGSLTSLGSVGKELKTYDWYNWQNRLKGRSYMHTYCSGMSCRRRCNLIKRACFLTL